jgi:hypothetical protein
MSDAVDAAAVWPESVLMSQRARSRAVLTALVRLSVIVSIVGALGACLPAHLRATDPPSSPPRGTATPLPVGDATPAEDPSGVEERSSLDASDPAGDETFNAYSVTKPQIRDRAFDWDLQLEGLLDVYDDATTDAALQAAAHDLLELCRDQQRWLATNTDHDRSYQEPMRLWASVVDGLCSGAVDVVRGVDRRDEALVRKGRRAIQAARALMTSDEYFGAWGPLLIH